MTRLFIIAAFMLISSTVPVFGEEWALPSVSVAHVRTEPRHGAEMSTQILMGHPVMVLRRTENGWCEVTLPDGYNGYIIDNSLTFIDDDDIIRWRNAPRATVSAMQETKAYSQPDFKSQPVTDLVPGDIVELTGNTADIFQETVLPDGRKCWVCSYELKKLEQTMSHLPVAAILNAARNCMGTPYLWGGLSVKGMDCSGLTKLSYLAAGYIIPRDASQQALAGIEVDKDSLSPSDIVFFGNPDTRRINHVAIYIGEGLCFESAGKVKISEIDDIGHYITARRLLSPDIKSDVVPILFHPWYFCQDFD